MVVERLRRAGFPTQYSEKIPFFQKLVSGDSIASGVIMSDFRDLLPGIESQVA